MNRTLLTVLLLALAAPLRAQQPREHHPWGRHPIGSWKRVRVLKMTFDEHGRAGTSIEESTTTLVSVTDRRYTLRIETTVDVAGSKFKMAPKEVTLGFHGEAEGQQVAVKQLPDADLQVDGSNVNCQVTEVTISGEDMRRVSKQFLDKRDHSTMRLETAAIRPSDESVLYQTTADVICLNMLHMAVKDLKPADVVRTVHQRPDLATETWELQCAQVPGGLVEQWSKTSTSSGRLRERSHLKLVDYEVKEVKPAPENRESDTPADKTGEGASPPP